MLLLTDSIDSESCRTDAYDKLLYPLGPKEAVLLADAVHPTHAAHPVCCWTANRYKLAIEQTSGRQHPRAPSTSKPAKREAETIDALSTIRLLESIEALYPALIHVFLDNARYHHTKLVQEWLARPVCRIRLHFVAAYCPHLNPIERLRGVMHKNVTHNRGYATYKDFAEATLGFLRQDTPTRRHEFRKAVTDNFRVIIPKEYRVGGKQGISGLHGTYQEAHNDTFE